MLKKILSYGFVEGIAKGLNKLIFLVIPLFLNTFDYGKIGLIVSLELLIPIVSLLGLERAVLRFYGDQIKFPLFKKTVFTATFFTHVLLIFLIGILYLTGIDTFFGLNLFPDIFLVILIVYFQGFNLISFNMLRVNEEHKKYLRSRLFSQVLKFLLVFSLIIVLNTYLGYLIGALLAVIITSFFLKFIDKKKENEGTFHTRTFKNLFVFSWPFIFHGLAGNLLGNADKFILEEFMTLNEVGQYTLTYSIGSMMVFAYVGVSIYMEPMIYKEKNSSRRELLLDKYLLLTISLGLVGYILLSLGSLYILPKFYNENYQKVLKFIPLIALAYLVYPYYLIANYKMIYSKKSLSIAVVSILSASINVTLNIYLIPKFGIYGAILITIFSYFLQAFLFIWVSNKFRFLRETKEIIILGVLIFGVIYFKMAFYIIVIPFILFLIYIYLTKIIRK